MVHSTQRRQSRLRSAEKPRRNIEYPLPRTRVQHNYVDHLHDPIEGTSAHSSDDTKSTHGPRGGVVISFPHKLMGMLDCANEEGFANVVSWQPHGRCFSIHQRNEFVNVIMPR